jgi:hypothetical protein
VPLEEALEQSGNRYEFIIAIEAIRNTNGISLMMFREIVSESEALLEALKGE